MVDESTVLEVKKLSKNFGPVKALTDVSFQLKRNSILGLVGDNGAGKTTLLNILGGALRPSSGTIYLEGKKMDFGHPFEAMKEGIATTHQTLALVESAPMWENFFMGREMKRKIGPIGFADVSGMKEATREGLSKYGFSFEVEQEVKDLSGGQRQILAVSRAMESNPKILLLDEPTAGLSKKSIAEYHAILEKYKENTSIILTSQWYKTIREIVDELTILRRGKVVGHFDSPPAREKVVKLVIKMKK